jgi:hypothetical protein
LCMLPYGDAAETVLACLQQPEENILSL